jgi:hypothetical protein
MKNISDHLVLMRLNETRINALLQTGRNFFLCHSPMTAGINSEQFQDAVQWSWKADSQRV